MLLLFISQWVIAIPIIVALAAAYLFFFYFKPKKDAKNGPAPIGFKRAFSARSPEGLAIFKRSAQVTAAEMDEVDAGWRRFVNVARFNVVTKPNVVAPRFYEVELEDVSHKCDGKGFLIAYKGGAGDPYDDSKYDKSPGPGISMCVAERVVGATSYIGERLPASTAGGIFTPGAIQKCVIRVANVPGQIAEAFYNGTEHEYEAVERIEDFWLHLDHTKKGHPILRQP